MYNIDRKVIRYKMAIILLLASSLLFIPIIGSFTSIAYAEEVTDTRADDNEAEPDDSNITEPTGKQERDKSTKQVIKDAAKDALNSVIEETIKAVGEGVTQSIRNPNQSIQTHDPEVQSNDGRRVKPNRW